MSTRLNYRTAAPDAYKALLQVSGQLAKGFPDKRLRALVELRVSQINGCAYCLDMHSREARHSGEDQQRLDCLPAWREVPFFTDRERAALNLAEAVTNITTGHVPDAAYNEAAAHFDDGELANLTLLIAFMNTWNRISISFRSVPERTSQV